MPGSLCVMDPPLKMREKYKKNTIKLMAKHPTRTNVYPQSNMHKTCENKKKKKCSIHRLFGSYLSSILYCIFCIVCELFCKNLFIIWKLCFFLFADDDILCPVKTFVHYKKKLNPKCVFLFQRPSKQPNVDVWYDNMPLGRN